MNLVTAKDLGKEYQSGEVRVQALSDLDFEIAPASFVSFVGPSGSGKTTLLNLIGCLDKPSRGTLTVAGKEVGQLERRAGARFRGRHIGFIFQDFNLLPVLTVAENIEYPLQLVLDLPAAERRRRVQTLLAAVEMEDQADKYPDQISGGQKQRVAVARALVSRPQLVLADEPTANLDHRTAMRVIELMRRMRDEFGTTFIFSTHDPKIVGAAEIIHHLEDGRLVKSEITGEKPGGHHG
ncbi:ABC transporter ATP-binding protein [Desulfurivibrio alkaliphilus]|uniref:ABC transporter related protein n=1 Tax=Desulfurivibrio alkaliphilus (strain DSM 19089 / UNIQEM U267 / AHT2) TaxID=589865 RepID=D6Z5Z6_DESAT|nr:ABC transporter ATP-binding protein [Desulfurivibrio alkaliphilus]ADH84878.1 ABC transporter related protein [Desulfurivibrio alkaliphilus AHT 2]